MTSLGTPRVRASHFHNQHKTGRKLNWEVFLVSRGSIQEGRGGEGEKVSPRRTHTFVKYFPGHIRRHQQKNAPPPLGLEIMYRSRPHYSLLCFNCAVKNTTRPPSRVVALTYHLRHYVFWETLIISDTRDYSYYLPWVNPR